MAEYQGYRSWNAWNVSLHIANDSGLYFAAVRVIKDGGTLGSMVRRWRRITGVSSKDRTPDGATYNDLCVRLAIKDMIEDYHG